MPGTPGYGLSAYEKYRQDLFNQILPGSLTLNASFFRNPQALGAEGGIFQIVQLNDADGNQIALAGVNQVGDGSVVGP